METSQTIANRFTIDDAQRDLLGRGGMGLVYRATDTLSGQPVAIKALKPDVVTEHPDIVTRFVREGQALRQLNHPNIVKMIAAVEEDGRHYLIMEYVEGGSLKDLLEEKSRLPIKRTLEISLDLADALTRAHRLDIVHRDLKPANVLLAHDGTPRLTDFGVARIASVPHLTQADALVGTVDYLSPEACRGLEVDSRADIWAFGVLLFEMLCGSHPFAGTTVAAKILAILTEPTPDLNQTCPEIPDGLADLIYRMLEKDPLQRIPSVRLVGAELEAILQQRDTTSPIPHAYPAPPQPGRFATPTSSQAVERRHNLPAQPTPFIGREAELAELDRLLDDPGVRLLTVLGPGGMGKTRLALETGVTHLARFEHGVYFVPLAPLQSTDTIVPTVADAIGLSFAQGDPRQQLLDYLSQKHMLLIMDNFEHLLDGANLTGDILEAAPNLKILTTSRARLNTRGEFLFRLTGMGFPDWETPQDALEYSAVKLFMQSARRVQPGFELQVDDLTFVSRICRLVQGLPLGILLAAAWTEMLSPHEIADEIEKNLDFLETDLQDVPERQRSIRAVFDTSWNALSEREQEVLQALAVFRGGFTRETAQQVTGASLRELRALVDKSLVHRAPEGRYDIHELLRQYAEDRLDRSPDAGAAARDRHCAHYTAALQQWFEDLKGPRQRVALEEMGTEIENARAAWGWAATYRQIERLDQMLDGLAYFYNQRGRFPEGEVASRQAAEQLAKVKSTAELRVFARILTWQGTFGMALGHPGSFQLFLRSLEILEQPQLTQKEDVRREKVLVLERIGWALRYVEPERARHALAEGLALAQSCGDLWLAANTMNTLGLQAHELGVYGEARKWYGESLAIERTLGGQMEIATTLLDLGVTTWVQGHLEESERLTRESIDILRDLGRQIHLPYGLHRLGEVLILRGKFAEAKSAAEESLALASDLSLPFDTASAHMVMSEAQTYLGEYEQALTNAQIGLSRQQATGFVWGIGFSKFVLSLGLLATNAHAEAQQVLQESVDHFRQIGHRENMGWALAVLAYADRHMGQPDQAHQHLAEALRIADEIDVFVPRILALPAAALLLADAGEHERAAELYALATRYPFIANSRWFADVAGQHIARIAADLPLEVATAAQERGRARDLDATLKELLAK